MGLSPEQTNSILRRKDDAENYLSREEGDLEKRKEAIMPKAQEQYEEYKKAEEIIKKAEELINRFNFPDNIPTEELGIDVSGFDDARLLAFCEIVANKKETMEH